MNGCSVNSRTVPKGWGGTLRAHLALARISNAPTVASNVLAGAALAGAFSTENAAPTLILLVVALVLFYTAGMYLNDLLDFERDRLERPERPLPSGAVTHAAATATILALFGTGGVLLLVTGVAPFLSGLVLIGLIVLYDAWHKTNPLSPVVMASTRALVYLTAFLAFSTLLSPALFVWMALLGLYIVGLTYLAKVERQPGLLGLWPAALLFLPALYASLQFTDAGVFLVLLFTGWTVYSLSFVYKRRDYGGAIGRLIAGVSLLDALVLAGAGSAVGVGLAGLAFGLTLFFQRYIKGT